MGKYYVIDWYNKVIGTALNFNEAVQRRENSDAPAIILKIVVDENGKEVK